MTGDHKLIVCFLAQGKGIGVIERLARDKGVDTANLTAGRGHGASAKARLGIWDEIDILSVVVPAARADEIFAFVYDVGDLDRTRGGIVFQHALRAATHFDLPDGLAAERIT